MPRVLQDRIDEKAQQRKEDQAEYDRVQEERRERLASLAEDAQNAKLVRQLLSGSPATACTRKQRQCTATLQCCEVLGSCMVT